MAEHDLDFNVFMSCDNCRKQVDNILGIMQKKNEVPFGNYSVTKRPDVSSGDVHVNAPGEEYMTFVNRFNKASKWVYSAKVDGKSVEIPSAGPATQ